MTKKNIEKSKEQSVRPLQTSLFLYFFHVPQGSLRIKKTHKSEQKMRSLFLTGAAAHLFHLQLK